MQKVISKLKSQVCKRIPPIWGVGRDGEYIQKEGIPQGEVVLTKPQVEIIIQSGWSIEFKVSSKERSIGEVVRNQTLITLLWNLDLIPKILKNY